MERQDTVGRITSELPSLFFIWIDAVQNRQAQLS